MFRHTVRGLLRSPVVTTASVVSLALSIGANTAAFAVLNALLFRTVAVPGPHDLVAISAEAPDYADTRLPTEAFRHLAAESTLFSGVLAWQGDYPVLPLEANGVRYASTVARVAGDYFGTLGIRPYLGRFFTPSERGPIAVIDYRCWERRFGRDAFVIGKSIIVEDTPRVIVGVTPRQFTGLEVEVAPEVTIPMTLAAPARVAVVARRRPGVSVPAVRARVDALWRALSAEPARRVRVEPFATGFSFFRDRQAPTVEILMVLSAAVLMIACLNLAMVMLSRVALRRHELGIRVALGAGPARLLVRSATEAFLLCGSGGVLGLVFASWAGRWLISMLYTGIVPTAIDASPDFRVCAFAAAVSCASALIFGLAPIRAIFRIGPADALRASPRTSAGGGARFRRLLTASQIALSLAIVSGALLVARSLHDMRSVDLRFRRDRLLMVRLFLRTRDPIANRAVYYHQLAEAFQRLPGVESVAYSGIGPAAAGEMNRRFGDTDAAVDFAGPGFFRSIGMRVIAGREFTWSDDEHATPVAIISDGLATRLFPQTSAIGRSLSLDGKSATIVGIVGEAELWNPRRRTPLAAYFPILQDPKATSFWVNIRTLRDPARLATPVRRTLDSFGRHTALTVQTLDERMDAIFARERMAATLAGFLAGLAVLLASVGIYAFMRNAVADRTPEFGVRLAVGASPADLAALVVRDVAALALAGIAAGLPLTLWSSRLLRRSIFGIPALDPVVLLIAAATLVAVAFAAAWHPARRAASISPLQAIRAE